MILCIDVGNSNICVGAYKDNECVFSFRLGTKEIEDANNFIDNITMGINQYSYTLSDIEFVMVDSVVPAIDAIMKQSFDLLKLSYYFVDYTSPLGINILLDDPSELGSDILVGLYQANQKYGAPCIVVDMGTATTIIALNEKKELLGGVIYPGLVSSFNNLFKDTSKLIRTNLNVLENVIGTNTKECIQSGMLYGTSSAINGVIELMKEEMGNSNVSIIITGGLSSVLQPYIKDSIFDENLLLDGLLDIYYKVVKKERI